VQRHIRDIAYGIAGLGIIFAVLASLWIAARISRPIEELARAAGRVAEGDWETRSTFERWMRWERWRAVLTT